MAMWDSFNCCLMNLLYFLQVVKSVLRNHDNKIEDAIESLRTLSFRDASERSKAEEENVVSGESSAACKFVNSYGSCLLINLIHLSVHVRTYHILFLFLKISIR